jgi:hypothetical protein
MPDFPQYQNAQLVTYANYRPFLLTGSAGATINANSGDCILVQVNAVNVSGVASVRLPSVALGGPVLVKFTSTNANTAFGSAATVTVAPALTDVQAATEVTIDGRNAITLNNLGDECVFASDGSNWWIIDKSHNTHDTY